jgi:phospholipid/cholesterol/gamma-HCH transport system substrate-binding protein
MAQRQSFQIGTGLFILLGFLALGYLATQTTSLANYRQKDSFTVSGEYTNIGQLKLRAPVKLAGVRIGTVTGIEADPTTLRAKVSLSIDKRFDKIPADSAASIFTSGLLGDQYVSIQPGGLPDSLKDGDTILLPQPAMQLEELIGKYLVGDSGKPGDKTAPKPDQPDVNEKPADKKPAEKK